MADLGLFNPTYFATKGVVTITNMDFIKPAAMLRATTSEEAFRALPVTGPTTNVTVPAPIVVILTASE